MYKILHRIFLVLCCCKILGLKADAIFTREEKETLLLAFTFFILQGGMVLVSHDERLIRAICNELWVCSKGKVHRLEGGLDEYRKIVEQELVI